MMFTLPEVVIVHLKRFEGGVYGMEKTTSRIRVSNQLNLNKVVHPESISRDKCEYMLTSVIHHRGNLQYGHYTASVYKQQENKWYLLNDQFVSPSLLE